MEERKRFRRFEGTRELFFHWLDDAASRKTAHNAALSTQDVLGLIELAREEVDAGGVNQTVYVCNAGRHPR